jgi:hypothetical protein
MTLVPNTGAPRSATMDAGLEAVLDTEWAGRDRAGRNHQLRLFTGANDADVDDAAYYAVEQRPRRRSSSQSWASCEAGDFTPLDADIYENFVSTANTLGITYLASSGDDGAAACKGEGGMYVNLPAAFPGVTGVGGTGFAISGGLPFNATGNVTGYGIEAVWNEAHDAYTARGIAAGGGGISSLFARPTYQDSIATCASVGSLPTGVTPSSMRQVPDVSFTAATGESQYGYFIECSLDPQTNDCTTTGADPIVLEIGGTSASTPSFAGVIALANQATGGRLGNVNPFLYALNATTPSAFHDITTGNNEVTCEPGVDPGCPAGQLYGYTATPGYDCASGLGSIDATDLVTAWACSPITVCPTGDNCGTLANGCGGTVTCGSCTAPQTCGGSGVANVCGCSPITVCPTGDNCGTLPNGCGGTVTCGSCIAPLTCGGTGTANVCGCSPITVCPAGDNCGTVPNGCGGTVTCGSCTAPLTCGGTGRANVCGCSPITVCPAGDKLRNPSQRMRWHGDLRVLHRAADLRRHRHSQRMRLLPHHCVPCRQQLRNPSQRLRRDRDLRVLHGAADLRGQRDRQCLRLLPPDHLPRRRQLRSHPQRLRRNGDLRVLHCAAHVRGHRYGQRVWLLPTHPLPGRRRLWIPP